LNGSVRLAKISARKASVLIVFIAWAGTCQSQFNDSVHYFLNLAATGIVNKTEVARSYVFNNQLRANVNKNDVSLNSTHSWIYGEQNRLLSNNDFSSSVDLNYRKDSSRFAYWALGNFDKSHSLKINKRIQYGAGASYDLIKKGNLRFNVSNGLLFESSNLRLSDSTSDVYHTWRNSLRLKFRFALKELIILEGVHFLQNSLSNNTDYIIRSNSTLGIRIYRWVSLTSTLTFNKLNRLKRENLLFTVGIAFEKYF
jgi:hypothetical protein